MAETTDHPPAAQAPCPDSRPRQAERPLAHSVILEAVERHADYEEQMRSLVKEAIEADAEIDRTGEVYRADDVHAWVARLARGTATDRPKPWRR